MLIPHVVQTEADKVFVNILNTQAVDVTDGQVVAWDCTTADGVRTSQPLTGQLALFAGLADGTVKAGLYGLAQVYGYKSTAQVSSDSLDNTSGDILALYNGLSYLQASVQGAADTYVPATNVPGGPVILMETTSDGGALASHKVFIKGLGV
jgi:hypothetical protein